MEIKPIQDSKKLNEVGKFFEKTAEINKNYFEYWKENTLFHWDFWLSWGFAIIPWVLWARYHDKKMRGQLLLAGFIALIISSWFDFNGVVFGLWYYTGLAIPTIPSYVPWDFCLLPILIMMLIQVKPKLSVYWKALIFTIVSTVGELIFIWLGFYRTVHWNILYSVPIYFVLFLVSERVGRIAKHR
ncbi:hypothetical protein FHS18_004458 [Paenibacillus phyllosphaerae]|uniref:Uncharacterized protein n=1 Tax=Paenibacillus phyllosphaerae TaxID=274593 RepID=A0A7W5B0X2_9BACL|nr:CBO0543 family protein [Paenibacillus phyllosphaerae]MBB3112357.1 hypothetical protein [Paenibacillus phyllosphaerae]